MAMQRGNLAYDITAYEPRVKQPEAQQQPRIKVKKNEYVQQMSAKNILITAAIIMAMFFAMLYGKVETNRLFGETTQLQEQLKALESENIALAAEYESRTSLKNVEEYAQNTLGLTKLDKSQIEYVEFEGNTVIEVVETEKKNIFVMIRNWISNIYEYLGA